MSIAAYVRISTVGQNEESQRAEISKWLAGNGISPTAVCWFVDTSTGDNLDRPAFEELQRAIFTGQIKTVVIFKLDRLSRRLREGINLLCNWIDRGLRVVSVTQQIDFNGTVGKMIASVLLAVAELEQETRRERQAAGIAAARKAGRYRKCGRKKGSTKANPERALQMRQRGLRITEIAQALGVTRNTVHRYLRSVRPSNSDTVSI